MSLLKTKYLRRRRIVTLIVILTLASTLFSITAYSFLGFYNSLTGYIGEGNSIIAVYSTTSQTPFTGIVPLSLENNITAMQGVISTSAETVTPCIINGQSVFVRGIVPQELSELNPLTMLQGENLSLTDTNSAIIGVNVAQKLNLKTGDQFLVTGVQSENYVELQVKGIYKSGSSLDDEALVPLYVGQWLRGISYNQVTLIRAKINPNESNANLIYRELGSKAISQPTTSPTTTQNSETQQELEALLPLAQTNPSLQNIGVEGSQQLMASYLGRYGVSKDTLIILSMVVLMFASGIATVAITLFINQHNVETNILRSIGVTRKKIKKDLFLKMLLWSLIATIIGTGISAAVLTVFQKIDYLQVLSQTITFQLDPLVIAANFIILSVLVGVNLARAGLN